MPISQNLSDIFIQTLEQAIDSVVVIDSRNRIVLFNAAAERLWGYSKAEVIGENVKVLVPVELQPHHDSYINANRTSGINKIVGTSRDVPIHRKDGSQRWGAMSISKVESEGQILYTAFIKDVTQQYYEKERLKLLSLVTDQTDSAIIITNGAWQILYVNSGFEQVFGYSAEEVKGRHPTALLAPQLSHFDVSSMREKLNAGLPVKSEELTHTKSGERIWSSVTINPILNGNNNLTYTVSILSDITNAKMHEVMQHCMLDAMVKEEPLENLMEIACNEIERIAPDVLSAIFQVDDENKLRPLAAPSLSKSYRKLIEGLTMGEYLGSMEGTAFSDETVFLNNVNMNPVWIECRSGFLPEGIKTCWVTAVHNNKGNCIGVMALYYRAERHPSEFHKRLVEAVTPLCSLAMEREESRQNIRQLAFYDSLTELPNRSLLHAKAEHALIEARRNKSSLAVLFLDIDRFKQVNDSLGHPAGDALLQQIAERLSINRRQTDIVGRLSGDEFVVVLPGGDEGNITEIVEEIKLNIAQPCKVGGATLSPSASIGISLYPQDGHDMGTLIHRADMAMYQAKSVGRGRFSFFSHELNQLAQERQELENALREAIERNELTLHYQPQINMQEGKLYGVEALARWVHPKFGMVSPARFIPLAEECGLIGELGHWAIKEACQQMAVWKRKGINIPAVSVNLSPSNFHNLDLCGMIMTTLSQHNLQANELTLELTESVLLDTNPSTMKVLNEVHSQGVRLAMDDFGTGYSSLSYLRRLPIHELKLDRSFVQDLEIDETSRALSEAVFRIGESLQLKVVAEGVEEEGQYQILKEQGYHVAQGYLLSKPLSAVDLEQWFVNARKS